MDYDDLSFTINDKDGNEVVCDIISIIPCPDTKEYNYVIFNDGSKDENDNIIFMYGKMKSDGEDLEILDGVSDKELVYIKKMFGPSFTKVLLNDLYGNGE